MKLSFRYILFILLLLLWGCNSRKKDSTVFKPVKTNIPKDRYQMRTASDNQADNTRSDLITEKEESIRQAKIESERPKTIIIDAYLELFSKDFYTHLELYPDGTVRGKADFTSNYGYKYEEEVIGSWHTGKVSRGTSSLLYYEVEIEDLEWYFTERFDYLWRGKNSNYTYMHSHDIDKAHKIINHYTQ